MKPIYIFRHQEYEGPGYLQQVLHQHQLPYQIFYIDQGETVPSNIEHCSALVFMGGPMSVNDELPWIAPELHLIRDAVAKHLPVLGHCLGGQLISKALGGKITANAVKEIGWLPVIK
jgi:GMP synthase-like glutamine amidotransferase